MPESNSRPNVSEGYMDTSELPGRPAVILILQLTTEELVVGNDIIRFSIHQIAISTHLPSSSLAGANPAVNTPRPSRGTRIE